MESHLWTIVDTADGVLIGGDQGRIYRIAQRGLAKLMAAAYTGHDDVLAAVARVVADSAEGALMALEGALMALEDALRERGRW